jgi:PBP1b-binding outer membrane lipoprotein LpoB
MKKVITIALTALIISMFLISCAPVQEPEPTGESDVDEVSSGISDVDTIDDDLSGEELDDLEQDLTNIDW